METRSIPYEEIGAENMQQYTIETPSKSLAFSTESPYVEAVLYFMENVGLVPKDCTVKYNDITIDPTSNDYNLKHYRKNYLKIMNNPNRYRSSKLFHINDLK
jgi:hypothetical protein